MINTQTTYNSAPSRFPLGQNVNVEPQEPNLHNRASELLKFVSELENHFAAINESIFGTGEQSERGPRISPASLDGKLADACSRVASLCGNAATLIRTIGNE